MCLRSAMIVTLHALRHQDRSLENAEDYALSYSSLDRGSPNVLLPPNVPQTHRRTNQATTCSQIMLTRAKVGLKLSQPARTVLGGKSDLLYACLA